MKIYTVIRTDYVQYEEFLSFVVLAESEEDAIYLCHKKYIYFTRENTEVKEIQLVGETKLVLGSFNNA